MEVHSHTHTARKKWTHYFWEFLMLFLAVFCGFLAEYQLEHVIENQREKKYMQSLIEDLEKDTADINGAVPYKEVRIKAIDTVLNFFKDNGKKESVPGTVMYCIIRAGYDRIVERNRGTIDQLTNAGGLRLIRNKKVNGMIKQYDHLWERAGVWREGYVVRFREYNAQLEKLMDAWGMLPTYAAYAQGKVDELRTFSNLKIHAEQLEPYLTHIWGQQRTVSSDLVSCKNINVIAVQLMKLIKEEYNLK